MIWGNKIYLHFVAFRSETNGPLLTVILSDREEKMKLLQQSVGAGPLLKILNQFLESRARSAATSILAHGQIEIMLRTQQRCREAESCRWNVLNRFTGNKLRKNTSRVWYKKNVLF